MSLVRRGRGGRIIWQHKDIRFSDRLWKCRGCEEPARPPWRFYCSTACRAAFWRTVPPHWSELRRQILKRDDHTCVRCRCGPSVHPRVGLEVDHLKPVALYPELEFEPTNLRTLCHDCHVLVGARPASSRWRAQHHPTQRRLEATP